MGVVYSRLEGDDNPDLDVEGYLLSKLRGRQRNFRELNRPKISQRRLSGVLEDLFCDGVVSYSRYTGLYRVNELS